MVLQFTTIMALDETLTVTTELRKDVFTVCDASLIGDG